MKIRNLAAIVLVFALVFSFCGCRKLDSSEIQAGAYVLDDSGVKHEVQTAVNDKGQTEYYYTDDTGAKVEVKKNDIVTTTSYSEFSLTPEQQSFVDTFDNPEAVEEYLDYDEAELSIADDIVDVEEMKAVDTKTPLHPEKDDKVKALAQSDQYTIDMTVRSTVDGKAYTLPVLMAKSGDNMLLETKIPADEGGSLPINIFVKSKKCTFYLPSYKICMRAEDGALEEFKDQMNGYEVEGSEDAVYSESYTITADDGTILDVDVYDLDGTDIKYFYNDDTLRRVETKDADGNSYILEYNKISDQADASKFVEPTGYIDMTDIMDNEDVVASMFPNF